MKWQPERCEERFANGCGRCTRYEGHLGEHVCEHYMSEYSIHPDASLEIRLRDRRREIREFL